MSDATILHEIELASLWSGYGKISRITYQLPNGSTLSTIKKQVKPPHNHRLEADESHVRKLRSYIIERYFYQSLSRHLPNGLVPNVLTISHDSIEMQDLSRAFPHEHATITPTRAKVVLSHLATFHASFWTPQTRNTAVVVPGPRSIGVGDAEGVWQEGSYWTLRTRMSEYAGLSDRWKALSRIIDRNIRAVSEDLVTLVHGDCKSANIMFSSDFQRCVLFDFQYIGKSPGVRDLVYFFTSSVADMGEVESELLRYYFTALQDEFRHRGMREVQNKYTFEVMMDHYEICLLDYYRFMLGWGMWGDYTWAKRRVDEILKKRGDALQGGDH